MNVWILNCQQIKICNAVKLKTQFVYVIDNKNKSYSFTSNTCTYWNHCSPLNVTKNNYFSFRF